MKSMTKIKFCNRSWSKAKVPLSPPLNQNAYLLTLETAKVTMSLYKFPNEEVQAKINGLYNSDIKVEIIFTNYRVTGYYVYFD